MVFPVDSSTQIGKSHLDKAQPNIGAAGLYFSDILYLLLNLRLTKIP